MRWPTGGVRHSHRERREAPHLHRLPSRATGRRARPDRLRRWSPAAGTYTPGAGSVDLRVRAVLPGARRDTGQASAGVTPGHTGRCSGGSDRRPAAGPRRHRAVRGEREGIGGQSRGEETPGLRLGARVGDIQHEVPRALQESRHRGQGDLFQHGRGARLPGAETRRARQSPGERTSGGPSVPRPCAPAGGTIEIRACRRRSGPAGSSAACGSDPYAASSSSTRARRAAAPRAANGHPPAAAPTNRCPGRAGCRARPAAGPRSACARRSTRRHVQRQRASSHHSSHPRGARNRRCGRGASCRAARASQCRGASASSRCCVARGASCRAARCCVARGASCRAATVEAPTPTNRYRSHGSDRC